MGLNSLFGKIVYYILYILSFSCIDITDYSLASSSLLYTSISLIQYSFVSTLFHMRRNLINSFEETDISIKRWSSGGVRFEGERTSKSHSALAKSGSVVY